jgi:integrase
MDWSLYDRGGHRKYLTVKERQAFLRQASKQAPEVHALCWVLHDTGCRLSEALELTAERVDRSAKVIVFESLKKRQRGIHRAVPISSALLDALITAHGLNGDKKGRRLWPWCRMTAYRRVKDVMGEAGIIGPHATSKGLRHGFAVAALEKQVPLNLVQKWLGHARMATTAIYAEAVGAEERKIARRLWQ